jgi:hypothetical protein
VLETALPTELAKAIPRTHAGELWVPRQLLTHVVKTFARGWMSCTDPWHRCGRF